MKTEDEQPVIDDLKRHIAAALSGAVSSEQLDLITVAAISALGAASHTDTQPVNAMSAYAWVSRESKQWSASLLRESLLSAISSFHNAAICDVFQAEMENEGFCTCSPDGKHKADPKTVTLGDDVDIYFDVNCAYCGRSGCAGKFDENNVDW